MLMTFMDTSALANPTKIDEWKMPEILFGMIQVDIHELYFAIKLKF